ncbi:hypothetical protein BUZ84_06830 [Mammaliicoccus sciuri]|uniref:hypothetical protein n=1 Tax=Mammaliicoccus sciuri TaxID=1296 RepID=UPI000D1F54EF|nr:hypothetical protein [Mammaliicoccus sciuri]PTJ81261.1 hypothetical protein BUZ84_06830 [Mammaliicoccus sciuri]UXU79066.1 hypothetical protein MUA27_05505 [Mammaliicoccus sciuri]
MSINLSFTQFMNYAVKNGSPRITVVKTIKRDDGYHPGKDYWKEFRDMIRKIHQSNSDISMLDNLLISIPSKKVSNYRQAITKYKSFIKGKNIEWFDPPKSKYSYGDVTINVNHELGLYINGKPYLVKLLLAKDATRYAKKSNLQTTLALSYLATEFNQLPDETKSMILIVDKKKTYESTYPNNEIQALLKSEILSFETIFNSI